MTETKTELRQRIAELERELARYQQMASIYRGLVGDEKANDVVRMFTDTRSREQRDQDNEERRAEWFARPPAFLTHKTPPRRPSERI